jgi:uncharacterized protein
VTPQTTESIHVEVVYATPERQEVVKLKIGATCTVAEALEASGLLQKYPEIDLSKNKLGVFSKLAKPETVLRHKDRVEIYRPLIADPKEVRKKRASEGKAMKKGGGDV